jgi:hypothetical protein
MSDHDGAASLVRSDALLARRADVFQGRADQCSEMATWLSLNGCADSANHLRNVAEILSHAADQYRANTMRKGDASASLGANGSEVEHAD